MIARSYIQVVAYGLLSVTVFFYGNIARAQDTALYSLQRCIIIAIDNNQDVRDADYQLQSNGVNVLQARATAFPAISGNITHGINQGRSINPYTNSYIDQQITTAQYALNAGVVLWNGSSVQNNIRYTRLSYEASKEDKEQAKNDLTINVILAYLQVLSNQDQLKLSIQQADVTRKQVERLALLDKEGNIAPATLYDQKGQLGADELNIISNKNALESSKIALVSLMNIPYSAQMQLQPVNTEENMKLYNESVDDIGAVAIQQYAAIKAATLRTQSATANVKALRGMQWPTLSLNGSLGTNYSNAATIEQLVNTTDILTDNYVLVNGSKTPVYAPQSNYNSQKISYGSQWSNNLNSYIGLGLQIPIFNGLRLKSQVKQAKIVADRVSFQQKTIHTRLRQSIEQAYVNMNTSYERYQKLEQQVKDYKESFRAATIKFEAGVITSVDYTVAKNNFDHAATNLVASKYDYILKTKILDYYQGKLQW